MKKIKVFTNLCIHSTSHTTCWRDSNSREASFTIYVSEKQTHLSDTEVRQDSEASGGGGPVTAEQWHREGAVCGPTVLVTQCTRVVNCTDVCFWWTWTASVGQWTTPHPCQCPCFEMRSAYVGHRHWRRLHKVYMGALCTIFETHCGSKIILE